MGRLIPIEMVIILCGGFAVMRGRHFLQNGVGTNVLPRTAFCFQHELSQINHEFSEIN